MWWPNSGSKRTRTREGSSRSSTFTVTPPRRAEGFFGFMGRAVRATATLGLRQYTTAAQQIAEAGLQSPDLTNVATVREGDTLLAIAFREYGDASRWRPIAEANGLSSPLALVPGQPLVVPKVV